MTRRAKVLVTCGTVAAGVAWFGMARLTRRTAQRFFTHAELEHAKVRASELTIADARFRLAGSPTSATLKVVEAPDDAWLREQFASLAPEERVWETVAFLKVRRLASPQEIIERARSGDLYDESYFTQRGGGAPYVGYPLEYNGYDGGAASLAEDLVSEYAPHNALDVGCATGLLVHELERRGVNAAGIDFSTWAIEHAVTPSAVYGSATDLPWRDASFDLIVSQDFMEHVDPEDLRRVLAEQRRVLRPGGAIVHLIPFYPFDAPIQVDAHLCQASQQWWTAFLGSIDGLRITREPLEDAPARLDRYYELRHA